MFFYARRVKTKSKRRKEDRIVELTCRQTRAGRKRPRTERRPREVVVTGVSVGRSEACWAA